MEPSSTVHLPQTRIGAGLGLGRMLCRLTARIMKRGLPAWADVGSDPLPKPDLLSNPRGEEAWRSYAVYSGALSPCHHKSSRRRS